MNTPRRNAILNRLWRSAAVIAVLATSPTAWGVPITTNPFEVVGNLDPNNQASVLFNITSATDTTLNLEVTITNLSPLYDPIITAFAFNAPDSISMLDTFSFSGVSNWDALLDFDDIGTPQSFGVFDICAESGNNQNNCSGGNPNDGITRTNSATFSFGFAGTGLAGLSVFDFLGELSQPENNGNGSFDPIGFLTRFQRTGADGRGSDVAVPVSEPSSVGLLGLGLLLLGFAYRRRSD